MKGSRVSTSFLGLKKKHRLKRYLLCWQLLHSQLKCAAVSLMRIIS